MPVTASEEYLARLCRRAFLSLWSYANVYTDESKPVGKGVGRELCDLLVVFGNDVLVFSDKHVEFNTTAATEVAWSRWYRHAIAKSVSQLHGARNWITRFPDRLYLDPGCTTKFPIALPPPDQINIRLIAVTRGSYTACQAHFGGNSIGSLRLSTGISGSESPFTVGLVGGTRGFVHVFDEFTLDAVFSELDTVLDFVGYLRKRESFLSDSSRVILAAGEEQLLAMYLKGINAQGDHDFVLPEGTPGQAKPSLIVFDESFWDSMKANPTYINKKKADQVSYVWDNLINQFISEGRQDIVSGIPDEYKGDIEPAVRTMASESRLQRRMLGESFIDFTKRIQPDKSGARLIRSTAGENRAYVLYAASFSKSFADYDDYRRHRVASLAARCRVARILAPEAIEIVGIAFDAPNSRQKGGSEDLVWFYEPTLTDEMMREAEHLQQEFGLFLPSRVKQGEMHCDEYPENSDAQAPKSAGKDATSADADSVARELFGRPAGNRAERRKLAKALRRQR